MMAQILLSLPIELNSELLEKFEDLKARTAIINEKEVSTKVKSLQSRATLCGLKHMADEANKLYAEIAELEKSVAKGGLPKSFSFSMFVRAAIVAGLADMTPEMLIQFCSDARVAPKLGRPASVIETAQGPRVDTMQDFVARLRAAPKPYPRKPLPKK